MPVVPQQTWYTTQIIVTTEEETCNHNRKDEEHTDFCRDGSHGDWTMPERTVIFCLDMFAIGVVENDRADVKHLCISVRHQTVSNAEL